MPWYGIVVVVTIALSSLATIAAIGKPREPISPGMASSIVFCNGLIVWAIVALGS